MFEKEAKEYTKENLCKECHNHCREGMCTCTECKKKTFKDGAKFGYNKALEEVKHDLMMKLKDEGLVKPLKDSILRNERLSSQEQQELCAWIECAMDFGENLDECAKVLEEATHNYNAIIADYDKRIAELEKENAELKADNDARMFAMAMSEKVEKQLREENAKLKKEVLEVRQHLELTEREWGKDTSKFIYYKTRLTKATTIIKKFSGFVNNTVEYTLEHPQEITDKWNELCEQAEQFLKEVDK